jgi:hypothetical protein
MQAEGTRLLEKHAIAASAARLCWAAVLLESQRFAPSRQTGPVGNRLRGLEPCRLDLGSWNAELQVDFQKFLRHAFLLSMGSGDLLDSRTTQARDLTTLFREERASARISGQI